MVTEINKGYVKYEVGEFPEDWNVILIGDSLKFKNGLNKESEYFGYGTPIVNYMDVFNNHGIRQKNIEGKVFLNREEKNSFSAKKGDVFFTRTSETQEEIGNSAVLLENIDDCVFSGFILRGRPKNNIVLSEYYQYCLTPNYVRNQIISTSSYTTRALTNGRFLSKVKLIIPATLEEQKSIATALTDVDKLITRLEKLISKKKDIKRGAMQQLLTPPHKGGKRLSGFSGDWVEKTLGEIINLDKGEQLNKDTLSSDGEYPVINGGVEPSGYCEKWNRSENTITISEGGNSCGFVNLLKTKFWSGGHCYSLKLKTSEVNQQYLYLFLKHMENSIMSLRVGSGLPNIQKGRLLLFNCSFPNDIIEQKAIAQILSDIDAEITQLETKKEKYQNIKQGMMQELLTGKTRLV